ncbi:hypothetical protein A3F27_00920 [Candidatus Kaiserbacteria bacterium RIFCSPHIGHO2_12_FULL_53_13]|uniref:Uncharacterized protein n=1 Tax=Candidatus Kaiserbacteria bacterium RIFCSPHIGHO2_12_FULL_53_13 TaxID=1798502 RepID=A0A1F6E969_9BACT|nr:MAG: hypothetical protein A3F27_00920 [Candidatus Kaiserbacteria bacterium RIFCSPHIGHO2_12_FULL_53_13]OGG74543.1 MAG: hypothetical protein A3A37_01820 [Candidatus Kaiserbacteria bacterium RIFCSPLOWO2_01_FULL_52_36]
MLSTLPSILFLAPFSAFLIRIALALTLGLAARKHFSGAQGNIWLATVETVTAIIIFAGAWTQVGAIAGTFIICAWLLLPRLRPVSRGTALLALVLCLSLIVTGAGAFAFDLPL